MKGKETDLSQGAGMTLTNARYGIKECTSEANSTILSPCRRGTEVHR